jgi:hypothetical protein
MASNETRIPVLRRTMSTTPVEAVIVEPVHTMSKKRQVTATVAAGAITIALGLAANYFIEKAATRVKNTIAPETTEDE